MIWRIGVVLILYGAVNLFLMVRGFRRLRDRAIQRGKGQGGAYLWLFAVLMMVLLSFLTVSGDVSSRLSFLPDSWVRGLLWLGADWMVLCLVWSVFLVLADGLFGILQWFWSFSSHEGFLLLRNGCVLLCLGLFLGIGSYNALCSQWTEYDIVIPKVLPGKSELNLVCISDLHIGDCMGAARLEAWVQAINQRHPDLICLAGDIFDQGQLALGDANDACQQLLAQLSAPMGVYACIGNHDLGFRNVQRVEDFRAWLAQAGIHLLFDEYVMVDGLVLAGKSYSWQEKENPLAFLQDRPSSAATVVLLNHKPEPLAAAAAAGVDLVLSGHTHRGQIFPGNLVTARLYETDYGFHAENGSQTVVSSGVGVWGPVLRLGSRSELVQLHVHFTAEESAAL